MAAYNAKEGYVTQLDALWDWEDGQLAIPAQEFLRSVAAAPATEVTITENESRGARIESGTARWNIEPLVGVDAMNFRIETVVDSGGDDPEASEMIEALEAVRYAASKTENRPSFQQVHLGDGYAVASDGRRVHKEAIPHGSGANTYDIPIRAVETLLEALSADDQDGLLHIEVDADGEMSFTFGDSQYSVGRLAYGFPDLEAIVFRGAREQIGEVTARVSELVTAVKVASVAIDQGGHVRLNITNGVIEVEGHSSRSEGRMEVQATTENVPSGTEMLLVADDLLELLGRIKGEEIMFSVSTDPADQGWFYVWEGNNDMEAALRPVIG